jgi:hypothetical protein
MKAGHRKELQTNVLASGITKLVEGAKSKPNTRTLVIVGAVALIIALIVGWRYFSNRSKENLSNRWRQLYDATSAETLADVAQQGRGTDPGRMAEFREARVELKKGLDELGSPPKRDAAVERVKKAAETYERLAQQTRELPAVLVQEALLNAAKARESLGELDSALTHYRKLADTYPTSDAGKTAADRVKQLTDDLARMQDFYKELQAEAAKPK